MYPSLLYTFKNTKTRKKQKLTEIISSDIIKKKKGTLLIFTIDAEDQ